MSVRQFAQLSEEEDFAWEKNDLGEVHGQNSSRKQIIRDDSKMI